MSRAPHDLEKEQLALGELDAATLGVEVDPAAIAALRADDDAIRARYPARSVALRVRERLAAQRRRTAAWLTGLLAPAAVAGMLLVAVRPGEGAPLEDGPDVTVLKGQSPDVQVFALKDGGPARVTAAAPGQRVQLALVPAGARHAVLLSVDGRGGVTLHFPARNDGATAVDPRETLRLPESFELDDAPAFERFVLLTSDTPLDVGQALEAARALAADKRRDGALTLPAGVSQTSRVIEKTSGVRP
jgi:hypothetical protein